MASCRRSWKRRRFGAIDYINGASWTSWSAARGDCADCELWEDCKGRAVEADGFYRIDDAISKKRQVSEQTWLSEYRCRDELNKAALHADSLRKQGMTKVEIASHLGINVRRVSRLLARASRYYRDLVKNFDQERFLGESLVTLLWMEREALKNLEAVDAANPVAVEWLEAALDIRRGIKELLQNFVFGMTRSGEKGSPCDHRKSRRDKTRARLKKLDKGKERNLYCVRPDPQGPDSPNSI